MEMMSESGMMEMMSESKESPYAFLSKFDTVFLIDDSASMVGSSWNEVKMILKEILPIVLQHDTDGPDIYFMNHRSNSNGNPEKPWKAGSGYLNVIHGISQQHDDRQRYLEELFNITHPQGATPTGERLDDILRPYMRWLVKLAETGHERSLKPLNIIVITDGEPSDDVESVIIQTARKLDKMYALVWQVGIQFFQVGNEPGASEKLRQLDDDISARSQGEIRDIVDTTTFDEGTTLSGETLLKTVLGAVDRRLDNKNCRAKR